MSYFALRMKCLKCSHEFDVWVQSEILPDADEKFAVRCPMNLSPYTLSFSLFKPVDTPPADGVEARRVTGHSGGACPS